MKPIGGSILGVLAGVIVGGIIIGFIFLAGGIANMLMIPHPIWVWIVALPAFLVCGYAGGRAESKKEI